MSSWLASRELAGRNRENIFDADDVASVETIDKRGPIRHRAQIGILVVLKKKNVYFHNWYASICAQYVETSA